VLRWDAAKLATEQTGNLKKVRSCCQAAGSLTCCGPVSQQPGQQATTATPLLLPLMLQARRQLDTCLDFRGNTLFASVSGKLASGNWSGLLYGVLQAVSVRPAVSEM
jgi:hypothetical protein